MSFLVKIGVKQRRLHLKPFRINNWIKALFSDSVKPDILRYFYKFTPKARAMVKTVTMDLNCYYPSVVRELFPNSQKQVQEESIKILWQVYA